MRNGIIIIKLNNQMNRNKNSEWQFRVFIWNMIILSVNDEFIYYNFIVVW